MFKALSFLFIAILLAGCSATGPKYVQTGTNFLSGKSEIVIFREGKVGASGSDFCIQVDDKSVGLLQNGGYLKVLVEPGKRKISVPFNSELELTLDTKPNETSYIEFTVGLASMFAAPIGNIAVVSASWDMAIVYTPADYSLSKLREIKEAKYDESCKT